MKVGVFLNDYVPDAGGGFTIQDDIFQAAVRAKSKHQVYIISNFADDQIQGLVSNNIQHIHLQRYFNENIRSKLTYAAEFLGKRLPVIRSRLGQGRKTILESVVERLGIEILWYLSPGKIEVDIPYICTIWDLQHRLQPWFPEVSSAGLWHLREKTDADAISRASAILVPNEASKSEVIYFYRIPPDRIKIVPHPTPGFALHAARTGTTNVLSKYNIPEGYLFYPAQFWPHKNHINLLLAVSLLEKKFSLSFPVVFVGADKGNLQYVRQYAQKLNLSDKVHFLGFVETDDLIQLYRYAFALTYLTFFGPENLPPLEAFALGCPVIASDVSGAKEQLDNAALLVNPKDENQIAGAIKQLHDDPGLRNKLIASGKKRSVSWTAQDYVKKVFATIDDLEPILRCWGPANS